MTHDLSPTASTPKPRLGDRIRSIAEQLRQEDQVQIHATSRILGAAAQIAHNHDRLVDEVVDMVEEDLERSATAIQTRPHTVEQLRTDFGKLKDAKAHFNLKARSWDALVDKLNQRSPSRPDYLETTSSAASSDINSSAIEQRLKRIEQDLQGIRHDLSQLTQLTIKVLEQKGR